MAIGWGQSISTVRGPLGLALALLLAVGPVALAGPRCQVERLADARQRLAVWGRELAGAKGAVTARAARHVAMVQARGGAVLDALFLVTLQEAGDPARSGASLSRPQWVRCTRQQFQGNRAMRFSIYLSSSCKIRI